MDKPTVVIVEAFDGETAIQLAVELSPAVILLDTSMPGSFWKLADHILTGTLRSTKLLAASLKAIRRSRRA